jgi:IPT/TIG domain
MKNNAIIILLLLSLSCSKEEITNRPYPRVTTVGISDINSSGVTFHGEIFFSSVEIIDHGFIFTDNGFPSLTNGDKVSLGPTSGAGNFDMNVQWDLVPGRTYSVTAYATSTGHAVYGKYIEFTSLGSLAPAVTDFSPKEGTWGDTITITGKNLGGQVMFGSVDAKVAFVSGELMKVIVPLELIDLADKISVVVGAKSSSPPDNFILKAPVITDFTPKTGTAGDGVRITGKYFHPSANVVMFNGVVTNSYGSASTIDTFVPQGLSNGNVSISVKAGAQTVVSSIPFVYH